jgi:hypothetical protein
VYKLLRVVLAPLLALLGLLLLLPGLTLAVEFLTNPGLNHPSTYQDTGRDWNNFDESVADGWWYYYVADGTYKAGDDAPKLHWMSSQQYAQAFGGLDYYREGDAAQVIWSSYEFDAGIYQHVTSLTIGQDYTFEVAMASFWRGSGFPTTDGKMKKCLGIDPYGGTDPTAGTVIWDWDGCDATDKTWPYLNIAATAQATSMTLFVRIQAPDNESYLHYDLDYVFIDDARLALAPSVTLTVPAQSDPNVELHWAVTTDPDWSLQGIEVQYKDQAESDWHIVQDSTEKGTSYTFQGQPSHTYSVRARAWQQRDGYDLHGVWVEKQVQVGGAFAGYVRNNFDAGIAGAQVSITGASATAGAGGYYALEPPAYGTEYNLTASASGYLSPPPITGSVADQNSVTTIDFTLKPANDAITNGDFETDTNGWNATGSVSRFSGGHRSGSASLNLLGSSSLSQTVNVSGMYNPTLSFWYKPDLADTDSFEISLQGSSVQASRTFTATAANEWQHVWLPLDIPDEYDGPVSVTFHLTGGQVLLDEVSLGDGPHQVFLPLVFASSAP